MPQYTLQWEISHPWLPKPSVTEFSRRSKASLKTILEKRLPGEYQELKLKTPDGEILGLAEIRKYLLT